MMLTNDHKKLMAKVRHGVNIWTKEEARILRDVEKEHPEYIDIVEDMNEIERVSGTYDGTGGGPYFFAVLTRAGKTFLDS